MPRSIEKPGAPGLAAAMLWLASVSLALSPASVATAKISCDHRAPRTASVELVGLPAEPEVGRAYEVTADLRRAHAVNPRPYLFTDRCDGGGGERRHRPGVDMASFPVPGARAGEAGYSFDIRFERPGRWLVGAMDVSGHFSDFGFYDVAQEPSVGSERASLANPVILAGLAAAAAAAAVLAGLLRRSLRRR